MSFSKKVEQILSEITKKSKLGDIRKLAKEIKMDHDLALELWSKKEYLPRQLAILIMDKKQLNQKVIDQLDGDISEHPEHEKLQLID